MRRANGPDRPEAGRVAAWSALLLTGLALGACRRPSSGPVRIMDALTGKDVSRSPFFGLARRLPTRTLAFSRSELFPLEGIVGAPRGWFAFVMPAPVLPGLEPDLPPELTILSRSARLDYRPRPESDLRGWSLLSRTRPVPVGEPITLRKPWSKDVLLPPGLLTVRIRTRHWSEPSRLRVVLELDGERWGDATLDRRRNRAEWSGNVGMGGHRLALSLETVAGAPGPPLGRAARVRVDELELRCASELLLLAPEPADAAWSVSWTEAPDGGAGAGPASASAALFALLAGHDRAFGEGEDRAGAGTILRKLKGRKETVEGILAAPPTEFSRTVRLPDRPVLELGCGVVPVPGAGRSRGAVRFRVAAERDGREVDVFDRTVALPLGPEASLLPRTERVDLSAFSSRTVRLIFRTEGSGGDEAGGVEAGAFWHNPVVSRAARADRLPPNVILLSLDTLRADHLGCYGHPRPVSPRLDALAADSVRFERASSASNWTLPSHVSLLTGLLPARHGVFHEGLDFAPGRPTLAGLLRERGWSTGAFTAGGLVSASLGFDRGFDFYVEGPGLGNRDLRAPETLARRTLDWVAGNAGKPFFLFLHTYHPHDPYRSPEPFGTKYLAPGSPWTGLNLHALLGPAGATRPLGERERENVVRLYDGDVSFTDAALVGPLVDGLKRLGVYDRTLIVVTSDHGESFFEHGSWLHGRTLYEPELRVPLIVKLPRGAGRGRVVATPVSNVDALPTVLDALGVPYDAGWFDGRSLLPLATGRGGERREIVSEMYAGFDAFSRPSNAGRKPAATAVIDAPYKLIRSVGNAAGRVRMELYDLGADPGETIDLVDREPGVARRLLDRINAFYAARPAPELRVKEVDAKLRESLRALGYVDHRP